MKAGLEVEKLLYHDVVVAAFKRYRLTWLEAPDFPFLTYIGVNFKPEGIHSVKFYFHLFPWLDKKTVARFLPTTEDFFRYYHLHDQSGLNTPDTSGVAFTVKFYDGQTQPDHGFHYRMHPTEQAYNLAGGETCLPFDPLPHTHSVGISHEYGASGNEKVKRYLYFRGEEQKAFFAEHFGYPMLTETQFIEFAESKDSWKVNTYYGKDLEAPKRANKLNSDQLSLLDHVKAGFGLNIKSYGYSQDCAVKSVYLFNQNNHLPELGIADMTQQYVDTIGHMFDVAGSSFGKLSKPLLAKITAG